MSNSVQNINKVKTGTCPHGLAPGACPICSMGGGSMKQSDRNRKIGEMTYHECAMIGNMLRARALAEKNHENSLEHWAENQKMFESQMAKMSEKMALFAQQMSKNFLLKPMSFLVTNLALPTLNFVKNIPNSVASIADKFQTLKQKVFDITDKLTAIYGEIKNFIQKKVSELISNIKTKFIDLFKIFRKHKPDDEDTKIDEEKRIFHLKNFIKKISTIFKKKKDKNNEQNRKH